MREPDVAPLHESVLAGQTGYVAIDNRRLARVAKLAGAPNATTARIDLHVRLDDPVQRAMPLFTLHAEAPGELAYAKHCLATHPVMTSAGELSPSTLTDAAVV